ncbi:MAG TPA: serine hydrolase [Thermoleophilia bacterium]|nr:serine hydrolase [Thermoleophilia bacterium]
MLSSPPMIAWHGKNLATGRGSAALDEQVVPSFSTIKVLLAAAFWKAVEAGELNEARPYAFQPWQSVGGAGVLRGFRHAAKMAFADYIHLSLVVSDNDATNIMLAYVGHERVADLAALLGLEHTALQRRMMDWESAAAGRDNVTCARDLAILLEALVTGDARIGSRPCELVLRSLGLQEHLEGLPRSLPAGATYAGKPGDDQPAGRYAHDCGLVTTPDGQTLVLAVLTDGEGGYDAVSRRGRELYDELTAP